MSGVRIVSGSAHKKKWSQRPSERTQAKAAVRVIEGRTFVRLEGTGLLVMREDRGRLSLVARVGSYFLLRYPLSREDRP